MRSVSPIEDDLRAHDGLRITGASMGVLIVVGGHSRGVGKTTTIEEILRQQACGQWAAVKVSAHRHCEPYETRPLIEQDLVPDTRTQTGRYLIAGAARAFLCRTPAAQLAATAGFIRQLRAEGLNVLVESNRVVDFVDPDIVLFAVAPRIADWKASSGAALPRTHAFVIRDADEARALEAVGALASKGRLGFAPGHRDEATRFQRWLAGRLPAAWVERSTHASVS